MNNEYPRRLKIPISPFSISRKMLLSSSNPYPYPTRSAEAVTHPTLNVDDSQLISIDRWFPAYLNQGKSETISFHTFNSFPEIKRVTE